MAQYVGSIQGRGGRVTRTGSADTGLELVGGTPAGEVRVQIKEQPAVRRGEKPQHRVCITLGEHLGAGRSVLLYDGFVHAPDPTPPEALQAAKGLLEEVSHAKALPADLRKKVATFLEALRAAENGPPAPDPKELQAEMVAELRRQAHQALAAMGFKRHEYEPAIAYALDKLVSDDDIPDITAVVGKAMSQAAQARA